MVRKKLSHTLSNEQNEIDSIQPEVPENEEQSEVHESEEELELHRQLLPGAIPSSESIDALGTEPEVLRVCPPVHQERPPSASSDLAEASSQAAPPPPSDGLSPRRSEAVGVVAVPQRQVTSNPALQAELDEVVRNINSVRESFEQCPEFPAMLLAQYSGQKSKVLFPKFEDACRELSILTSPEREKWFRRRFEEIKEARTQAWFARSKTDLKTCYIEGPRCWGRSSNPVFEYSKVRGIGFDATILSTRGRVCLTSSGPLEAQGIERFFEILKKYEITHVVCLSQKEVGGSHVCSDYWTGKLISDKVPLSSEGFAATLSTETFPIMFFKSGYFFENPNIDAQGLLDLVIRVKRELNADPTSRLLVHYYDGATGIFFAALEIVDAIDNGKPFSIEEIIFKLSIQRKDIVPNHNPYESRYAHYKALYELAEEYLATKPSKAPC